MRAFVSSCGVPDIAKLREEYNKTHQSAGDPAANKTDWQAAARQRMAIEKIRF